jgi:serine phosphatase RsbU (regulator of sigma subunit)/ligand-binding sensor domain-containing protein
VNKNTFLFNILVVLFLFLRLSVDIYSQPLSNTNIKIYNQDNGIEQNFAQAVLVDKNNFIWIGTQAGLNKFNGYNFELYINEKKNENSLNYNDVTSLFEDREGKIWVGTLNGLNRIDKLKNKVERIKLIKDSNQISSAGINSINQNTNGKIIAGGYEGKLFIGNSNSNKIELVKTNLKEAIFSIVNDKQNNQWIGTDGNGLFILRNNSEIPEKVIIKSNSNEITNITSLCFDKNDDLLIGTRQNGVFTLNTKDLSVERINSFQKIKIKCIFKDSKNRIWVGTEDMGLFYKESSSQDFLLFEESIFKRSNYLFNNITCITEDFQGNVWLTCRGGGLVQINFQKYPFKLLFKTSTKYEIVNNTMIVSLYINDNNEYWCGLPSGELLTNENVNKNLTKKLLEYGTYAYCIYEKENDVFIGTSIGAFKADKKTGLLTKIVFDKFDENQKAIIGIKEYDDKIIFILYGGGLAYIDNKSKIIYSTDNNSNLAKLESYLINCITSLGNKYYFAGTEKKGLLILDKNFRIIRNLENPSISDQYVLNINCDYKGRIYLGYNGTGLDYIANGFEIAENINAKPLLYNFNNQNGLLNTNVMSILLEDENNVWVSSTKGIFNISMTDKFLSLKNFDNVKINKSKNEWFSIKTYLGADGLPCNEFNNAAAFKSKDNQLYFGGINGVVYFDPKKLTTNVKPPIVSLTNFKVFGTELKLDTNITYKKQLNLTYSQNIFSIDFVALDYTSPEKNQFAYKLEGFDNDWIYSGQRRFANYTNIDPGDYIFKVKASNNDGVWNEKGIELKISISPPFYKTKWFYSLSTLLFFALIYTFIKRREIQLKRENKLLESKVTQRTKEIENINSVLYKKNRDITDSINYAKRIQEAFLLPEFELKKLFKDSFIFFNPKDIVSGDFYWFTKEDYSNGEEGIDKLYLVAVADCTGHGVPGALMSMIGIDRLSDCSKKTNHPGKILKLLNQSIKDSLRQSIEYSESVVSESETTRDGMDICLCQIAYLTTGKIRIRFSGANRPIWIISNSQRDIMEIKQNKTAIGGFTAFDYFFDEQELTLEKGDKIYMFTDGYCDQFGGADGKKFLTKRFRTFLSSISHLPMFQQSELLEKELQEWMGAEEQVDDLLVIGFTV